MCLGRTDGPINRWTDALHFTIQGKLTTEFKLGTVVVEIEQQILVTKEDRKKGEKNLVLQALQ